MRKPWRDGELSSSAMMARDASEKNPESNAGRSGWKLVGGGGVAVSWCTCRPSGDGI